MGTNRYIILHGSAKDRNEAISMCGEALYKAGIVSSQFAKLCMIREREYPTGLPTEIPTAIPHAKDNITENSICFLKLESPVAFKRMDDDSQVVLTDMIFNLAIKDPEEHLKVLQNMMTFLNDSTALKKCRTLDDDDLIAYLQQHIG